MPPIAVTVDEFVTQTKRSRSPLTLGRAAVELAILVVALFVIMWALPFMHAPSWVGYATAGLVLVYLAMCQLRERADRRELGLRFDNFWRALRQLAIPIGVGALVIIAFGFATHSLRPPKKFLVGFVGVPVWGFTQQYMLLAFCNRRLQILFRQGRGSVITTALLFGIFHTPNPTLMVACAIGGYIWADQFEREPNLFATALTHGIASSCLANSMPRWILGTMRVGYTCLFR